MEIALVTIFSTSFVLALSGALMPGPLLTVTVSESSRRGTVAGPLMICGHGLLELAMVAALLAGLAPILVRDDVFIFISLTGGAILLYMGISMLKSLPGMVLHGSSSSAPAADGRNLVVAGLILSAVNPYWLIWWASIGLGYIVYSMKFGLLGVTAFFCGHILADFAWYTLVSFGIARGRHLLGNSLYRKLIGGCAVFLIAFACWFFYSGVNKAMTAF
ncbi:MAG TPA: lysine transporter LysE [Desulfobulbaceae bacterium]|nr:lysine transporter LysE [Desulfobulbaceae bacterium]